MRNLFLLISIITPALLNAQIIDSTAVGKITYYEGRVEIGFSTYWTKVKINTPVKKHQEIKTIGDAIAEIVWSNGVKSLLGPNSQTSVLSLLNGSTSNAKEQTQGSFDNFKRIFVTDESMKRTQEGGIRRDEAKELTATKKDELYWKEDREILFSEAYGLYEEKKYAKAILSLQGFIEQKPKDAMTKYATFALGHCYIQSNNPIKAREIFDRFVIDFRGDQLVLDAKNILASL